VLALLPLALCCRVLVSSGGQVGDLYQVVGEDAVSAPDPGSVQPVDAAAVPVVAVLEVADASFASGAPLDELAERRPAPLSQMRSS
jgi:hypothetical protein